MVTSMLDGGAAVALPRRPLQVRVQPAEGLVLEARLRDGGDDAGAKQPRAGLLVLPVVAADVVIVARSATGAPLPADAAVAVDVVAGAATSADPDRAVLSRVRLGGLAECELLEVTGDGPRLLVRAAGERLAEVELGPLGNAARAAASGLLGRATVPPEEALNIVVAVDLSASFRPRIDDGALAAVLAVLSGVAAVVVGDLRTGAVLLGDRATWMPGSAPADLASALLPAAATGRPTSAFRSGDASLALFDPDRNTQVYLVTDAVPGDLDALETAGEQDGQGRHLVLLADESARRAGRATTLPVTVVEPEADLADRLVDPRRIVPIVRSLLQGCFAPGSACAERVRA